MMNVFISVDSGNQSALRMCEHLEQTLFKNYGIGAHRQRLLAPASDADPTVLDEQFKSFDGCIALLTESYFRNDWLTRELFQALVWQQSRKRTFVIPVRLEACQIQLPLAAKCISFIEHGLSSPLDELVAEIHRISSGRARALLEDRRFPYVSQERLNELKHADRSEFDPSRLVRMLEELNVAHEHDMHLATAMLVRGVVDHVPTVFKQPTFAQVAAEHSPGSVRGKSFKKSMKYLNESMRNVADAYLHSHMRSRETLPTATQVDYRQDLDVLLGEVARVLND